MYIITLKSHNPPSQPQTQATDDFDQIGFIITDFCESLPEDVAWQTLNRYTFDTINLGSLIEYGTLGYNAQNITHTIQIQKHEYPGEAL